ncbi:unnamed protein product, partial [Symbiodinium necroappetens]
MKTTESTASSSTTTGSKSLAFAPTTKTTESTATSSTTTGSLSYVDVRRGDRIHQLEDYADSLLVQDVINYQSAEDVITRIPMGRKMRNVMKPQGKQSGIVTFGLFAHGAMNGVTRSTQEMPQVCRFINRWIKSLAPSEFTWSSVTIGVQTTADVHMDAHNDGRSKNMSVTLGKFSQGELWLQRERDAPRQFVMSGGEEESKSDCECVHDYETVFECEAADLTEGRRMGVKKCQAAWRRLTMALVALLSTARSQMVVDHLMQRQQEELEPERTEKPLPNDRIKKKTNVDMAMGIGKPLRKSDVHKEFPMKVTECNHPADALRCRGNQAMKWWVCTRCGSRWDRPGEKTNSGSPATSSTATSRVQVDEKAPKLVSVRGQEFPHFLPAPRGRPQQGAREVTLSQTGAPKTNKESAASSSTGPMPFSTAPPTKTRARMTPHGVREVRRSKTPTRTGGPETYELNTDHEDWADAEMINPNNAEPNARGWLLKSILVMLTLVETENAVPVLGTMFGEKRDQLWWHQEDQSWESRPPSVFPAVECQVFPRQQVRKDWLADNEGVVVYMNQAERKSVASAWMLSTVDPAEINSPPRVLQRAKKQGKDSVMALDLATGWDFERDGDRRAAHQLLTRHRPGMLSLAMAPDIDEQATDFNVDLARQQMEHGRGFIMECPTAAPPWRRQSLKELKEHPAVFSVVLDFARLGVGDGQLGARVCPTVAMTNVPELFRSVRRRFAHLPRQPVHATDYEMTKVRNYVSVFSSLLNQGLRKHLRTQHVSTDHASQRWAWQGIHLVCRHFMPRQHLCLPEECPFDISRVNFSGRRVTRMDPIGGQTKVIEDDWPSQRSRSTAISWTGTSIFHTVPEIILPTALAHVATTLAKSAAHDFCTFQSEQHELQAELAVFPSHRVLEGRHELTSAPASAASASARPSADPQSSEFDWDDFCRDISHEEARFITGGAPFARDEAQGTKETVATRTEEEARVAKELRELVIDPSAIPTGDRSVMAPDTRREVYRLHRNLGHPDKRTFLRAMRHAGVKVEVLQYIKDEFSCPICSRRQRPSSHRPGHLSREMSFNEVVGIDLIFFRKLVLLNCLCWGTGYQWVEPVADKRAETVTAALLSSWFGHYGTPKLVVADQGGEFAGKFFVETLSDAGVIVHFIDVRSPWQNGRTEKAGGLFKDKLATVIDEAGVVDGHEMRMAISETVWTRNQHYDRSGFTPHQRVFGSTPRVPASLLTDDAIDTNLLLDGASDAWHRSLEIRAAARKAWMECQDRAAVQRAARANTRTADDKSLQAGHTVFVWRETPDFKGWAGPGVIVAESTNGRSLWVSLRGYLIKASREQVRQATPEEHLGAELIKVISKDMLEGLEAGTLRNFRDIEGEGIPNQEFDDSADKASRKRPLETIDEDMEEYVPSPVEETADEPDEVPPPDPEPMPRAETESTALPSE